MPFVLRHAFVRDALPKHFAAAFVQAQHQPAMQRTIVGSITVSIQSGPEGSVALIAHCCGQEQLVAPDNRTRMGESGDAFLPTNVLALNAVPMLRKVLAIGNA